MSQEVSAAHAARVQDMGSAADNSVSLTATEVRAATALKWAFSSHSSWPMACDHSPCCATKVEDVVNCGEGEVQCDTDDESKASKGRNVSAT